ncbi:hypothetical protein [Achromobacter sp. 413638]|uniref:hypothetical protein n=1 Tax=Achromobacter sp. 413638 TaxID=3342385 RepID=UPI00370BAA0B
MRSPINVVVPITTPVGTLGTVQLVMNGDKGDTALLRVDVGHIITGNTAAVSLNTDGMRQLVDGLMDCIFALERRARINERRQYG